MTRVGRRESCIRHEPGLGWDVPDSLGLRPVRALELASSNHGSGRSSLIRVMWGGECGSCTGSLLGFLIFDNEVRRWAQCAKSGVEAVGTVDVAKEVGDSFAVTEEVGNGGGVAV